MKTLTKPAPLTPIREQHHFHTKHAVWPISDEALKLRKANWYEVRGYNYGSASFPATQEWIDLLTSVKTDEANKDRRGTALQPCFYICERPDGTTTCGMIGYDTDKDTIHLSG